MLGRSRPVIAFKSSTRRKSSSGTSRSSTNNNTNNNSRNNNSSSSSSSSSNSNNNNNLSSNGTSSSKRWNSGQALSSSSLPGSSRSSSSSSDSRLSSSILSGPTTNSLRWRLSSSSTSFFSSSSFPSSQEASAEKARKLFFEQLGFGNVVEERLKAEKEAIKLGLGPDGPGFVEEDRRLCRDMREEAVGLYRAGVFYPSFAFRGEERLDKKNVYNYELEGHEWDYAPSLLMYTRQMLLHLPPLLNSLALPLFFPPSHPPSLLRLHLGAYMNKIAVSTGAGSHFLKHTDNNCGDSRKLTLVYYMNPDWRKGNGGELRLYPRQTKGGRPEGGEERETKWVDVAPEGDTLVMFFSDELAHEVLPNESEEESDHRWTYTLWLVEAEREELGRRQRQGENEK
ncbi:2og-fe oxygenase [Nannochloropsis oceanica]